MTTLATLPYELPTAAPDDLTTLLPQVDEEHTTNSTKALARFEFESGRGNEGTKVLLVEWEDALGLPSNNHNWKIEWPGKSTVLSARDGAEGSLHRVYFLLAPSASIPTRITLSQGDNIIHANPLPAIFPPELGITATTAGKKGVLHTIWGKQRLSVLQKEIDLEMKDNGEGVGLEMALQEKQWIEENFGVSTKAPHSILPSSPRSPIAGRLTEKLKGLRLGTSAQELADVNMTRHNNPLSPDLGDVAVSSFSAFHGSTPRPTRAILSPPRKVDGRQTMSHPTNRTNSLDAMTSGNIKPSDDTGTEDGLFAIKLSPRSPDMTKSPFSFSPTETIPWKDVDRLRR